MIGSILVANRGEIARRIIRTAKRMGLRTVAVFSSADADAPHRREADHAVLIGPPPPRESYLCIDNVLSAARESGAQAVHPGYGFLSENADFADAVIASGLIWVGAPPAAIRAMGRKDAAKALMSQAGVPVTPGYMGEDQSPGRLAREAAALGWPVMIKAVAGGGGKGMRKVLEPGAFGEALESARREAAYAFGDDRVLLERFIAHPRHIEVQIFGDSSGEVVHLFERDCTIQRRHQKVIEEAPAPGMTAEIRQSLCAAAVRAAKAVHYLGAGTVEFIADGSEGLRADRLWFMEMNTRLQVEHPVTEAITGLDLVEWQIRVACGEPLPLAQDRIALRGHAIEARLYAEDPANNFLPSSGRLTRCEFPAGVRVDAAVQVGGEATPYYDPLLAKFVAHGDSRDLAAQALARACGQSQIWPIRTNAWFLSGILQHPAFRSGTFDTSFLDQEGAALSDAPRPSSAAAAAAAALWLRRPPGMGDEPLDPWTRGLPGFRANAGPHIELRLQSDLEAVTADLAATPDPGLWRVRIDGADFEARLFEGEARVLDATAWPPDGENDDVVVFERGAAFAFGLAKAEGFAAVAQSDGAIRSPMPGRIVHTPVRVGEAVERGQTLVVLEAMKMEHALTAPFDGVVETYTVAVGDQVSEGVVLVAVRP